MRTLPKVEGRVRVAARTELEAVAAIQGSRHRCPVTVGGYGCVIDRERARKWGNDIADAAAHERTRRLIAHGARTNVTGIAVPLGAGPKRALSVTVDYLDRKVDRVATNASARGIAGTVRAAVSAHVTAASAVVGIREFVDLAPVGIIAVTVEETCVAGDAAAATGTRWGSVGRAAGFVATSAVVQVSGDILFAPVGDIPIAIVIEIAARAEGARTARTRRSRMGVGASRGATAAMTDVGPDVLFTTVSGVVVATRVTLAATRHTC